MSDFLKERRVVDPVLTQIARGFAQGELIAEQALPVVITEKEGLKVPMWGKGSFAVVDTVREVNGESNVVTTDKADFMEVVLTEHDLAAPVDYRTNHESMWNERKKAIRKATNLIKLKQEIETAQLLGNEATYNAKLVEKGSAKTAWNSKDYDPVKAIFDAKEKVQDLTGFAPNILVLDRKIFNALKFNSFVQKYKGITADYLSLSKQDLIDILELDDILIGSATYLDENADKTMKSVWQGFASLITRTKQLTDPDETNPSFGYTFRRKGMPVADKYESVNKKIEYQRYTDIRAVRVVGGDAGYLFKNPLNETA